jgi:hypothetical protein
VPLPRLGRSTCRRSSCGYRRSARGSRRPAVMLGSGNGGRIEAPLAPSTPLVAASGPSSTPASGPLSSRSCSSGALPRRKPGRSQTRRNPCASTRSVSDWPSRHRTAAQRSASERKGAWVSSCSPYPGASEGSTSDKRRRPGRSPLPFAISGLREANNRGGRASPGFPARVRALAGSCQGSRRGSNDRSPPMRERSGGNAERRRRIRATQQSGATP